MLNISQESKPTPNTPAASLSAEQIDLLIAERLAQLKDAPAAASVGGRETTAQSSAAFQPVKHTVAFSGSGSEYFRIWIVNVLLTIVTLTLYSPWAKVRKLQYFYRNTTLDSQPFDYHANPWALFKGRLVALALLGAYTLSGYLGTTATLAFGALVIAIGPWLMWRSLRFKLANSSYRAVRFGFVGSLKRAYWVFGIATFVAMAYLIGIALITQSMAEKVGKDAAYGASGYMSLFGFVPFLFPLWHWAMKHYQHSNYTWASVTSQFSASRGNFYTVWFKYFAFIIGVGFMFVAVIGIFAALGARDLIGVFKTGQAAAITTALLFIVLGVIAYILFLSLIQAYMNSRLQNLIWNKTEGATPTSNTALQFHSDLQLWPLTKVMMWNVFLTLVTLGLYWPFAAIKFAKVRLENVSVTQHLPWTNIAPSLTAAHTDGALGSEAQDVFNVDFAL